MGKAATQVAVLYVDNYGFCDRLSQTLARGITKADVATEMVDLVCSLAAAIRYKRVWSLCALCVESCEHGLSQTFACGIIKAAVATRMVGLVRAVTAMMFPSLLCIANLVRLLAAIMHDVLSSACHFMNGIVRCASIGTHVLACQPMDEALGASNDVGLMALDTQNKMQMREARLIHSIAAIEAEC